MTTPGQTIGPFFGYALPYDGGPELVAPGRADAIRLHGRVLDGAGEPVPDALLELWQTDPSGRVVREPGSLRRDGWAFTGFGRAATDADGRYSFTTLRPGAPFLALTIFARGLLDRLHTRVYLPEPPPTDALLTSLPDDRRATLVAAADDTGYVFDVVLQGDHETVFLDHGERG
ncbi:peptidase associated/transthyretin-like domain-containing protein [Jatrophihabitans fulvus]